MDHYTNERVNETQYLEGKTVAKVLKQGVAKEMKQCKGIVFVYDNPRSKGSRKIIAQRQCARTFVNGDEWCYMHLQQAPNSVKTAYGQKRGYHLEQCRGRTQQGKGPRCRIMVKRSYPEIAVKNDVLCHYHVGQTIVEVEDNKSMSMSFVNQAVAKKPVTPRSLSTSSSPSSLTKLTRVYPVLPNSSLTKLTHAPRKPVTKPVSRSNPGTARRRLFSDLQDSRDAVVVDSDSETESETDEEVLVPSNLVLEDIVNEVMENPLPTLPLPSFSFQESKQELKTSTKPKLSPSSSTKLSQQCCGSTKSGDRCKLKTLNHDGFCDKHRSQSKNAELPVSSLPSVPTHSVFNLKPGQCQAVATSTGQQCKIRVGLDGVTGRCNKHRSRQQ